MQIAQSVGHQTQMAILEKTFSPSCSRFDEYAGLEIFGNGNSTTKQRRFRVPRVEPGWSTQKVNEERRICHSLYFETQPVLR